MSTLDLELVQRIRSTLEKTPNAMTLQLARDFNVAEVEIIRLMPAERVAELDVSRWEEIVRGLEPFGQVHVIVSNGGATLEAFGQFGGFSTWGEFFNVQTKSLDMHIRWPNLGAAFALEKPSHMDSVNTYSVQFFDNSGAAAFKAFINFGGGQPKPERMALFNELREKFRKPGQ
jgi:putative hemin transport protein